MALSPEDFMRRWQLSELTGDPNPALEGRWPAIPALGLHLTEDRVRAMLDSTPDKSNPPQALVMELQAYMRARVSCLCYAHAVLRDALDITGDQPKRTAEQFKWELLLDSDGPLGLSRLAPDRTMQVPNLCQWLGVPIPRQQ